MNDARLGDFLVKIGLITPAQLHTAREMLEAGGGKGKLANVVVSLGFASAEELGRLAATALRLPYISLDKVNIPKGLVGLLSKEQARKAKGLLVKADGKKFYVATFDPTNVVAFDELQFVLGGRILPVVATEEEVIKAFGHYYTERIQYDRSFDLPKSDTLDLDKPEMFDIRTARAKKQEAKPKLDVSGGQSGANRKALEDKLAAAAASTVQRVRQSQPAAEETPARGPALEIRDAEQTAPAAKAPAPAAAKPAAPAPAPQAPREAAADELPTIRDATELDAPVAMQPEEELEVVELEDSQDADDVVILDGDPDAGDEMVEGDLEPMDESAPAPASPDDLLSLFGAMAFGVEPSSPSSAVASPEADELAKLFMGALGGPATPQAPAPDQPADMHDANDLAKELAHMLLDQSDFSA